MTGGVIILTGPPGAGKTTLARRLAETSAEPAVHLVCDQFFEAIRAGFIAPWLPESNNQNRTVNQAIAAAAARYALGGYTVSLDGVIGPGLLTSSGTPPAKPESPSTMSSYARTGRPPSPAPATGPKNRCPTTR